MKEKLFELSYEARRENFICARFAQTDLFGREDMQNWVEGQWRSVTWDDRDRATWLRCLALLEDEVLANNVHILRRHARAIALNPAQLPTKLQQLYPLLRNLDGTSGSARQAACYPLLTRGVLLRCVDGIAWKLFAVRLPRADSRELALIEKATSADVREAVLASLFYRKTYVGVEGDPIHGQAERRIWLCECAQQLIYSERREAVADFDKAVACSADGRTIVHADRIKVVDLGVVHSASLFFQNKILLGSKYNEEGKLEGGSLADKEQLFVRSRKELLTHSRFVPDSSNET